MKPQTEKEVHTLLLSIDNWGEKLPEIEKSLSELYDYEWPDYNDIESPLPDEYLCDPAHYCEERNLVSFERFLIEREYVDSIYYCFIQIEIESVLQSIEDECVSYGEIAFLQAHQEEVKTLFPDEPILWEWAGIPEH